ncbi:hypothetical protein [Pseudomonas azerbaijanorientalis]|uniref:hypothetical protein n=1 Tax=Pseudomonas azerbaijanorientalis TaxID=2842350 RepID=UPI001C3C4C41|nr:hypothetical protein [Pseudomonas azerbaijanorientalis]QXH62747.1 hypothetical protein KSS91_04460 [Pseudomonas azerbaijanorientalis]
MSDESRDVLFFQEDDFISLRAYKLFLNEVLHRDFITHSTPETSKVLSAYAQKLSEEADADLSRFQSLVDDVESVRAGVLACVDQARDLRQVFIEAKPGVTRYRRVAVDTLGCAPFDFHQPHLAICSFYNVSGVVSHFIEQCRTNLKTVERYRLNVSSMERGIHPMFYRIVAARKQKIEAYGYSPQKPPSGSGTSPFDFRRPYRGNPEPQTLELYRLTGIYASSASALFNFGNFLNRIQLLLTVMIDRLSSITASSTYSTVLLVLNLVASLLNPLQLRIDRLQEWSDFMRHKGKYAVEEQ